MNNKVKVLAASIVAITLAGCGDTIEITKPDGTQGFAPATTKSTRSVAYFSKSDAEKLEAMTLEIKELEELVPSYTYDPKDYPVSDKKFTFKYGNGSAIESAYKAHYNAFLETKKKAEEDYQLEYDRYAAELTETEKELSKVQNAYDEATANIKPTLTKIDELKLENKAEEEKFIEATGKMLTAFNDFIVKESIPVNKLGEYTLRNFSYWEKTCEKTGFEIGRWDSFEYTFQYNPDLCVTKKLNKLPDGYINKFIESKEISNVLEEQTRIQVAAMIKQGDLKLRKVEVNGLSQQINKLQESIKTEEIIIRNKYNRSLRDFARDVEKATSYVERSKSNLERVVEAKEEKIANSLRINFGQGKYSDYISAVNDYKFKAFDSVINYDSFKVTKNANYNVLDIEVNKEKPYQVIFDYVPNYESEIYVVDTVSFTEYVKNAKMESPIGIIDLAKNKDIRKMMEVDKIYNDEESVMKYRVTVEAASNLKSLNK